MASTSEFDGDEFSNNLVSDLAPLLALFGEQVTIQFLGLSMGWADNVLLAMGPLGIITIILSAIRIGGSRRLKSLVGRARETQAIAEQELLSSTSANVCELWNGQQVTRLIGEPIGMMTVVAAPDGSIYTLRKAFEKRLITTNKSGDQNDGAALEPKDLEETLNFQANEAFLDLPPNLSLNARSKLASPLELWTWATLGVVLQASALAFPAVVTYYFEWNKGEIPVDNYGYPCFVVGTSTLALGIMLCGHIIEGATLETDFILTKHAKDQSLKILCLQEALTVGDQQFPSCAIFLAEEDGILRTSRRGYLKHGYTWSQATAATLITITGYVTQFIGLRALHWSATLAQLAVTLIMTGVRALARRSLASDPKTSVSIFKGHSMAWLSLLLRFEAKKRFATKHTSHSLRRNFENFFSKACLETENEEKVDLEESQFFCELISDHSEESGIMISWLRDPHLSSSSGPFVRDMTGYVASQLLGRVEGPLKVSVQFRTASPAEDWKLEDHDNAESLRIHANVVSCISETNTNTEDDDYEKASAVLCDVIEEVMGYLSAIKGLAWKKQTKALLSNEKELDEPLQICWGFDIREGQVSDYHRKVASRKHLRVVLQRDTHGNLWSMDSSSRAHLEGVISLSLYTNAARLMYATGEAKLRQPVKDFQRIVGNARHHEVAERKAEMQEWLGYDIESSTLSSMRYEEDARECKEAVNAIGEKRRSLGLKQRIIAPFKRPEKTGDTSQLTRIIRVGVEASFLGMFLSSSGNPPEGAENASEELFIERPPKTAKAFQFAQELFSLFILALASEVESIDQQMQMKRMNEDIALDVQEDTEMIYQDREISREHPVFKGIADIITKKGLAQRKAEAYILIIPAFAKYGLLPKHQEQQNPAPKDDQAPANLFVSL